MSDKNETHHPHGDPNGGTHQTDGRKGWKHVHRSPAFWIALFLMLAAMLIYLATDDLGGWHRGQLRPPMMAPAMN